AFAMVAFLGHSQSAEGSLKTETTTSSEPEETINDSGDLIQVFKDTRIVNGHSVETNFKGEMTFIIAHRFGRVNSGAYDLFGLDNATMRMGLDYGITNNLMVGIGRSTFEKTYDGYLKYRLLNQGNGSPVGITLLATAGYKGLRVPEGSPEIDELDRLVYTSQALIARKINDRLSIQIMPTYIHRNIVPTPDIEHDLLAIGGAFKFQLTKQVAIQAESYAIDRGLLGPGPSGNGFYAPISVGFDVETKGHVFQFHLSNSRGMVEKSFISETTGSWSKGDIHFGFNITRDFRVGGRK
ncbi:MAG: DUF5777 family beta-barrel protein, partial [Flavobacteriales bacterium]